MASFNDVLESAAEKLSSDERLRSNLTDDEFAPMLDWAIKWLGTKTAKAKDKAAAQKIAQTELKRIETMMKQVNDHLLAGTTPTLEAAAKPLRLKLPKRKIEVKDRASLIKEVLILIEGEWGKKK
jgi:hypothetical protein